jgi:hypothetical protein
MLDLCLISAVASHYRQSQNWPISRHFLSGASRDRTGDLLLAKQALSQLSYGPSGPNIRTAARISSTGGTSTLPRAKRPVDARYSNDSRSCPGTSSGPAVRSSPSSSWSHSEDP